MRCPRCSSPVAPEQDWCLECGAPARTRLAPTPNWQMPTVAIGTIIAVAGALLAFAFVKLTNDDDVPNAGTTPTAVVQTAPPAIITPPPAVTPTPTATAPIQPAAPTTAVPGENIPSTTTPSPTTTLGATTPAPPTGTGAAPPP